MTTNNPPIRPLAIVAGVACVLTALLILLGPSLFHLAEWTQYHAITVAVVFVTIAFLHLRAEAWRSGHRAVATGFVLLAMIGTVLIVGQSVGRQAENATINALSTADTNGKIAAKQAELLEAQGRLTYAESQIDKEQTGQKCGDRCKKWEKTASDRRIVVKSIEDEISALGPRKPVNARAEKIADLAEVFGAPRAKAIALWTLLEPFALTLLFELGSVISFAYAFPSRASISKPEWQSEKLPDPSMFSWDAPEPPKPRKRKSIASNVVPVDFRTPKHPVVEALESNGGSVASNQELARLMSVTPGESSKRVQELSELLTVRRRGKRVEISLKKTA